MLIGQERGEEEEEEQQRLRRSSQQQLSSHASSAPRMPSFLSIGSSEILGSPMQPYCCFSPTAKPEEQQQQQQQQRGMEEEEGERAPSCVTFFSNDPVSITTADDDGASFPCGGKSKRLARFSIHVEGPPKAPLVRHDGGGDDQQRRPSEETAPPPQIKRHLQATFASVGTNKENNNNGNTSCFPVAADGPSKINNTKTPPDGAHLAPPPGALLFMTQPSQVLATILEKKKLKRQEQQQQQQEEAEALAMAKFEAVAKRVIVQQQQLPVEGEGHTEITEEELRAAVCLAAQQKEKGRDSEKKKPPTPPPTSTVGKSGSAAVIERFGGAEKFIKRLNMFYQ